MKNLIYARDLRKRQTDGEKLLWSKLRNRQFLGLKFRRQKPINGYIVDFVNLDRRLIIELDGNGHNKESVVNRDIHRTHTLEDGGYLILRFWNSEILRSIDDVLARIQSILTTPHPNLSPKGRGDNR